MRPLGLEAGPGTPGAGPPPAAAPRRRLAGAAARLRGYWVTLAAGTALGVGLAGAAGASARARAARLEAEAAALERAARRLEAWTREFRPASPAESLAWRASERGVASLAVEPSERLVLARIVAERAEEVGLAGARVRFAPPEAAGGPAPQTGGRTLEPGPVVLSVELTGDLPALAAWIDRLPPEVLIRELHLAPVPHGIRARAVLATVAVGPPDGSGQEPGTPAGSSAPADRDPEL